MQVSKPSHNKYLFARLDEIAYKEYASKYSFYKRMGFRGMCAWASGCGVLGLVFDVAKGTAKEKITVAIFSCVGYVCSPLVCAVTNATSIINGAKRIHNTCAFAFECFEDGQNLAYLPFDMFFFGQPIPCGDKHRFELFGNFTNILDKID
jgi:hypothetical protein